MSGARIDFIRERDAPSGAPSKLCTQRPGFRKDPGLFHFNLIHFGCVLALRGRASMVLAVRDVRGPWPDHVQRDTTSDGMLAFGHSRSGFTDCLKRRQMYGGAAGSRAGVLRDAGASNMSRSSRRPRTPLFGFAAASQSKVGTRVRIPHATPQPEAFVELTLQRRKSAATIGRRRNP